MKKGKTLKYIDFENPERNIIHVTEEFSVLKSYAQDDGSAKNTLRPDVVVFINGIPIVSMELKSSMVDHERGIAQIQRGEEREGIPHFYKFIQLSIVGNSHTCKYGTVGSKSKFYARWREPRDENESFEREIRKLIAHREVTELDRLVYSLLDPKRFFQIVKRFTLFDGGVKKIARHQQFFGILKTLESVEEREEDGSRRGGIIWHTQGSGKSLTMVMLTNILKAKYSSSKVIIVTDRVDLDKQIGNTFQKTGIGCEKATTGRDLIDKFNSGTTVITTLIHKFETVFNDSVKIEGDNIFVLVDESHRTQGGDFHSAMKKTIPNGCYIGFTGTPLLKKEKSKNSFYKFGGEIHRYTIKDAVDDRAVLPLLYEGRLPEQIISNKRGMDKKFETITGELGDGEKRTVQERWAVFQRVASSELRLKVIADDITEHFRKTLGMDGKFKGMLATANKYEAVKYFEIFEKNGELRSAFVISDESEKNLKEEEKHKKYVAKAKRKILKEFGGSDDKYTEDVKARYENGKLDLLIVVDKLLTGFDAPIAMNLYVDKNLKEHNLLQAIARVNRLHEGKEFGFIIDYRGLLGELSEALTTYSAFEGFDIEDIEGAVVDIKKEIEKLREYYTHLENLFDGMIGAWNSDDAYSYLKRVKKIDAFKELLTSFAKTLSIALGSDKVFDVLTQEEILEYRRRMKDFNALRRVIQQATSESMNMGEHEWKMQQLLDTYVNVGEMNEITDVISIFDREFEKELENLESANTKADAILSAVNAYASENMEANPSFYKTISQQIEDVLKEYNEMRLSEEEKLNKAKVIQQYLKEGQVGKSYPKSLEGKRSSHSIYDNLLTVLSGKISDDKLEEVSEELTILFDEVYEKETKKPEWESSKDVKNKIESAIEDRLWDLSDEFDKKIDNEEVFETIRGIWIGHYGRG